MREMVVGGEAIPVIGLGTWQFGTRGWGYGKEYSTTTAFAIVARAVELGVRLIDTAEIYGFGRSERIVGRAIAQPALSGVRDEIMVATKLYPALPIAPVVRRSARRSAGRLGIDRIDLYQLHAKNPAISLSHTMRGMAEAQQHGIIDRVGVSNLNLEDWQEAERAIGAPVWSNQVRFNLLERGPSAAMIPWARSADRVVIAHSPLAQGLLSGDHQNRAPDGNRAVDPKFSPANQDRLAHLIDTLRRTATSYGATAAQVALAWVLSHPNVLAIPGARTIDQLERNIEAADLVLSPDDVEVLAAAASAVQFRTPTRQDRRRARVQQLRGLLG